MQAIIKAQPKEAKKDHALKRMKTFYKSKVDKIAILKGRNPKLSFKVPKVGELNKAKVAPSLNYSEVFYGGANFGLKAQRSPINRDTFFSEGKSIQVCAI